MQQLQNFPNINNDLDLELKAEQNEDFEQQYLEFCLKETRQNSLFQNGVYSIRGQDKSNDAINSITPKPEQECLEKDVMSLLDLQAQVNRQSKDTGSSLMIFFFIRRFLEKVTYKKRQLEKLNEKILNLICDKASENLNILAYTKSLRRKELTFHQVRRILTQQLHKQNKTEKIKETIQTFKKECFKGILWILECIPLIQPESLLKMYWDWLATIFRGVLVFLVPLEISFKPGILLSDNNICAIILFIILQLDFFVKINTICYQHGKAILDRWEILKLQINRSAFIDYCLTFILIFLNQIPEGEYNLILLVLLLQLKYIYDSFLKMDQISYLTRPQRGRLGLIKFMVTLIYVAHIFSCVWFWFSSIDQQSSWIITKGLDLKPWSNQYLEAFYFAVVTMLTIGYGDNVPVNSIEKIITIIFILCACLWFSYSINFIGGIINDITQNQVERNRKMRVINKYMNERVIPYALQYQIKEYLTFRWKEDDEVDLEMEQALLGQLSDELKEELDKQAYQIFIKRCDFLQKNFSLEFRNALFKSIKRKIILPQNTLSIDMNGEPHLIFLEQGVLLYQHKERKQRSKINAQIDQGSFVCLKSFIESNPEKEYFKAAGYVSLLILAKSDFLETLQDFPEDCEKYCQLKDKITLLDDNTIIKNGSFCPVCSYSEHSLNLCPQVQHISDREFVIKRHIYNQNQQRRPFKRRIIEKPIMTRAEMLFVQECARIFVLDNPQLIQNQLKSQLIQDDIEINLNYLVCDDQQPSVKIFPYTQEYLVTSSQQRAVKNIESEIQLDTFIERRKKSQTKFSKPITKIGSITYDHKLLRKNTKSPSLLSQLNEPSIENSPNDTVLTNVELDEFRKQISDFNSMHSENITKVYRQLQRYDDQQTNKLQKDISYLFFSLNSQSEDLDQIHDYDHYFPNYNISAVLESINKNKQSWQTNILKRFSLYMFHPFQFILKFLKFKRTKAFISIINKFETIQRVRHKMILLRASKNSFKRNKVLPEVQIRSTKFLKK